MTTDFTFLKYDGMSYPKGLKQHQYQINLIQCQTIPPHLDSADSPADIVTKRFAVLLVFLYHQICNIKWALINLSSYGHICHHGPKFYRKIAMKLY